MRYGRHLVQSAVRPGLYQEIHRPRQPQEETQDVQMLDELNHRGTENTEKSKTRDRSGNDCCPETCMGTDHTNCPLCVLCASVVNTSSSRPPMRCVHALDSAACR